MVSVESVEKRSLDSDSPFQIIPHRVTYGIAEHQRNSVNTALGLVKWILLISNHVEGVIQQQDALRFLTIRPEIFSIIRRPIECSENKCALQRNFLGPIMELFSFVASLRSCEVKQQERDKDDDRKWFLHGYCQIVHSETCWRSVIARVDAQR